MKDAVAFRGGGDPGGGEGLLARSRVPWPGVALRPGGGVHRAAVGARVAGSDVAYTAPLRPIDRRGRDLVVYRSHVRPAEPVRDDGGPDQDHGDPGAY